MALVLILGLLAWGTAVAAAPGDRDPAYGVDGVVQLGQNRLSLLPEPGGRVVVFGTEPGGRVVARRLAATGSLDPTFGTGGVAVLGAGDPSYVGPAFGEYAVFGRLDPAGRIVAVDAIDGVVRRLTADGLADANWPAAGVAVPNVFDLAIDSAGRAILATGVGYLSPPGGVVRLTATGTLDPSFGAGGRVTFAAGGFGVRLDVDAADRPVVGLQYGSECGPRLVCSGAVVRLSTTGATDSTFQPPAVSTVLDVVASPDATILVSTSGPLLRLRADGTQVAALGTPGRTPLDPASRSHFGVPITVAPDGATFVGDSVSGGVVDLRADLSLDTTFGHCGYAIGRTDTFVADLTVADGRLLVAHANTVEAFQLQSGGPTMPYVPGHAVIAVGSNGAVVSRGPACVTSGLPSAPRLPVVGVVTTPTYRGLWMVASDGGVFTFGDAAFFGSTGALRLNRPVVGMAATPTGQGYWLVASDGGIFTFGDAAFLGSAGALPLVAPVTGMAATTSGDGYWLVARDGGIFTFGRAAYLGRPENGPFDSPRPIDPVVAIVADPDGTGYAVLEAQVGSHADDPRQTTPRSRVYPFGVDDPNIAGLFQATLVGVGLAIA